MWCDAMSFRSREFQLIDSKCYRFWLCEICQVTLIECRWVSRFRFFCFLIELKILWKYFESFRSMYPFASPRHRLYSVFWLNKHEMILILLVAQASLKRSEDEEKFLFRTLFGSAIQQKHFNENADERKKIVKSLLKNNTENLPSTHSRSM